jgi:hypothetical protein
LPTYGNQKINFSPTKTFKITIDSAKVVDNGTVLKEDADKIVDEIKWKINKSALMKSDMMILDLLAHNNWERPIYFVSPSSEANLGLQDYLQLEGFAYRLVPVKTKSNDNINVGKVAEDLMYENLMNKFKWGNINDSDVYIDYTTRRTSQVIRIRNKFARLAGKLNEEGENTKAVEVLDKAMELTPHSQIPYNMWVLDVIQEYYKAGATDKANNLVKEMADYTKEEINYYFALKQPYAKSVNRDKRLALHILHRLSNVTNQYGQKELSREYDSILNNTLSKMRGQSPDLP